MNDAEGFTRRLDAVAERLDASADIEFPPGAQTRPDPPTGERWEVGQVWAHLAEFVPYWIGQARLVIEQGRRDPVPFGRVKGDPGRLAAIERDRSSDRLALWHRVAADIVGLRAFLASVDEPLWSARGVHPSLGEMDLPRIVDEFLVGHLEQHADQLDELALS